MNVIELLMSKEPPETPSASYEVKRLTKHYGQPFVVRLRGIGYNTVVSIRERPETDTDCHIILESCTDATFKDAQVMAKYKAATPVELIKKLLLPGEIEDLARKAEKLSGYRTSVTKEVKKN